MKTSNTFVWFIALRGGYAEIHAHDYQQAQQLAYSLNDRNGYDSDCKLTLNLNAIPYEDRILKATVLSGGRVVPSNDFQQLFSLVSNSVLNQPLEVARRTIYAVGLSNPDYTVLRQDNQGIDFVLCKGVIACQITSGDFCYFADFVKS
jgi:hypothetical protein